MLEIPVFTANEHLQAEATALAHLLQLPYVSSSAEWMLELTPRCLQLVQGKSKIYVDFVAGKANHRRLFGGGRKQSLARACGIKPGVNPTILDATAGLGRDGFVLASLGCNVTLLERNKIIAALLEDGLNRARHCQVLSEIVSRLSLHKTDAIAFMRAHPKAFDTVYCDPMFPERHKKALVKKEMQCLQNFIHDSDADQLLSQAKTCAKSRIVVKRPIHAEPLLGALPDFSLKGKSSRFDIYMVLSPDA